MKRICIFGDSITWGMGLNERIGWSDLLRNHLEVKTDHYLELYSLGIDRNTTSDLILRMPGECVARNPDLIIIDIGTNDSLSYRQGNTVTNAVTSEQFKKNLDHIINIAKTYTSKIIFIGLALGDENQTNPLPRSTTGKCFTLERIQEFNHIIKSICEENAIMFIDILNLLNNNDFIDGLHPNEIGHQKIFNAILSSTTNLF